ncbi:MAG: adenylate kinase [Bacteroidales bacterium]|nr:adenylate kinase [Bacteroidales bacterium]
MKYYILFGPPGAGKGTQAAPMAQRYNLRHISTGALLRAEIAAGTALGKEAAVLIEKGCLVPDEVVEGMIESAFNAEKEAAGFILDGFPRTVSQARDLDALLARRGESLTAVVSLIIPDSVVKERIAGRAAIEGRADDAKPEVIENRIRTYHEKTEPLIAYYKETGKYHEVPAEGTIEEVGARINELVDRL